MTFKSDTLTYGSQGLVLSPILFTEKKSTESQTAGVTPKGPVFMDSGVDVAEDADGDSDDESDDIDMPVAGMKVTFSGELDFNAQKETFEKEFIIKALKTFKGRINQTALHANIPKKTLLRKIEKYGIVAKDYSLE